MRTTANGSAMTRLFAYETCPGVPTSLFFAETFTECRKAAIEQRSELRADPDYGNLGPICIFEVRVRQADIKTLLRVLNDNVELADAIIFDRKIVETIED